MDKIELNDRQVAWLKAHYKHTKNDEICARLGISASTMHRIAREYGLRKSKQFMRKMQEAGMRAAVVAMANENEEQKERRRQQARQNRNPERSFKPGEYALANKTPEERADIYRRQAEAWQKTRRDDEIRLNWGYKTKTKFRFARLKDPEANFRLIKLRSYMRRIGYEIPGTGGMKVYITIHTRRSEKMEARALKLGMRIIAE